MCRRSFCELGLLLFVVLVAVESAVLAEEPSTDFFKEASKDVAKDAAKDFARKAAPPAKEPLPLPIEFVAWKLGSQFNLAVVLSQRGNKPEVTKQVYEKARKLAALAGVEIPQLPEKGELPKVLKLVDETNQALEKKIAEKHGKKAKALFELSSMPMVLLLIYELEDAEMNQQFLAGITERAKKAKLPERLWEPVTKTIRDKGSVDALREAVLDMDDHVSEYLKSPRP